jgi:hypothetical protein
MDKDAHLGGLGRLLVAVVLDDAVLARAVRLAGVRVA